MMDFRKVLSHTARDGFGESAARAVPATKCNSSGIACHVEGDVVSLVQSVCPVCAVNEVKSYGCPCVPTGGDLRIMLVYQFLIRFFSVVISPSLDTSRLATSSMFFRSF